MAPRRNNRSAGFVTAELAMGTLGLVLVLYGLAGVFAAVIMQIRCVDAAAEIARQSARGDTVAVARVQDKLPTQAAVSAVTTSDSVRVHIAVPITPWGDWLPVLTISADAETLREGVG